MLLDYQIWKYSQKVLKKALPDSWYARLIALSPLYVGVQEKIAMTDHLRPLEVLFAWVY